MAVKDSKRKIGKKMWLIHKSKGIFNRCRERDDIQSTGGAVHLVLEDRNLFIVTKC